MKFWIGTGILERRLLLHKQSLNSVQIVKEYYLIIFMILTLSHLNQFKARKISGLNIWKWNLTALAEKWVKDGLNKRKYNQNQQKKLFRLQW